VTLRAQAPGTAIFYTLDGSNQHRLIAIPHLFALPTAGTVRALAVITEGGEQSAVVSREFDVAPKDWRVLSPTGNTPDNLFRGGVFLGQVNTPVNIVIDMGQVYELRASPQAHLGPYLISTAATAVGPPARFTAWVSTDGQSGASRQHGRIRPTLP